MNLKRLIIPVAAGIVLVVVGVAAGAYFAKHQSHKPKAHASKSATGTTNVHRTLYFAAMGPIVVNLSSQSDPDPGLTSSGGGYLRVSFQLESTNPDSLKAFKSLKPAILGNVTALMLEAPVAITRNAKARDSMKSKVLADVNRVIYANDSALGPHAFERVYITDFVTQPD